MTKIGVFTDIHSNIFALESMLTEMPKCDEYVCLGDLVCMGGAPNECFEVLSSLDNLTYLKGNHDEAVVKFYKGETVEGYAKEVLDHQKFYSQKITRDCAEFLDSVPYKTTKNYDGTLVTFLHYGRIGSQWMPPDSPSDVLKTEEGSLIVFGHTHEKYDKECYGKRFTNFGSLGCPHAYIGRGFCGTIEINQDKILVKNIQIEYDIDRAVKSLKGLNPPNLEFTLKKFYGV